MIQILWDRGEANGYAWHMTRNPYPNTPRHTVLLHEAFGDHQVANVATEVEARVIGARLRTPALDPGRSRDRVRSTASGASRACRGAATRWWSTTSARRAERTARRRLRPGTCRPDRAPTRTP